MKNGVSVRSDSHVKRYLGLVLILGIFLLSISSVYAVLITPPSITLEDFSQTQEQVITIINDQFEPIACEMHLDYLSSYISEYVIFEPERFILQPGEQKNIKTISSFPSDLPPQLHKIIIHSSRNEKSNSTISFRPKGIKRSELSLGDVIENSSNNKSIEDIIVSLTLENEGNTILFVTPTLEIRQNTQIVKEIVYPRPLIIKVGESYPLTLRQDTSELKEGKYQIVVRALYHDNEEEFFSEDHQLVYEVKHSVETSTKSSQQRNIIIGLIVGAFATIIIIWFKPKKEGRVNRQHTQRVERPLSNIQDIKNEIHSLKKEISHLTKEVSTVVDQAEKIKKN